MFFDDVITAETHENDILGHKMTPGQWNLVKLTQITYFIDIYVISKYNNVSVYFRRVFEKFPYFDNTKIDYRHPTNTV